jgi:type IV pilus assembly protein PilM
MALFGLDIGSESIKTVQLERKGTEFHLVTAGFTKTHGAGAASEAEKDLLELAESIKELRSEAGIIPIQVVASLPESLVFTRVIDLPAMTEEEVGQALHWELDEIIPIPLEEASFDWQIINQDQNRVSVLVAVAPKVLINKYLHVFELAQLQPAALETEVLAIVRALAFTARQKVKLIVNLGSRSTDIVATKNDQIILTRSFPTAGKAITRSVASVLSLEEEVAEEYKKTYGLIPEQVEGKVHQAILPVLEVISDEIQKSINFVKEKEKAGTDVVILGGGTANLPGLSEFITTRLGTEVQLADPFAQLVYDEKLISSLKKLAPSFVVAVGLAMREV